MRKKILLSLIIVSICGMLLTSAVLYVIQTVMARNSASETLTLYLDNAAGLIEQNNLQTVELIKATKEDYISRARALAFIVELDPEIIEDMGRMEEVAAALNVDEVYVIDENGILRWGNISVDFGMDFASTEQTRAFLPILDDPSLEIAQDPMPNGSSGLMRQYAGVSLRHTKGIAQIGMVPERMEQALKNNKVSYILDDIIIGNTGYVFAASLDTGVILSHPNQKLVGTLMPEPLLDVGTMTLDGRQVLYKTLIIEEQVLAAVIPVSELYSERDFYTLIFTLFMILVFGAFCVIVTAYIKRSVINGISETVGTLEAISAGNLDVTANVRSNMEFERLSDGINHMLDSIKAKMDVVAALAGDMKRLGAIVAIADAGIIVKDKDGLVLEWNIGAENIIGFKPDEIIGKTTKAYAPKQAHSGIDEIEERLQKGEHIAHLEVVRQHKDGRLIDCSASYTPIFGEDNTFAGSVAIFHDISEKKQIEQALHEAVMEAKQANEAKSSFLANMSHEIRTPLNGIIGFAELAGDDYTDAEKLRNYLEKIKLSGEGLLRIINDILDISKIEAGKMDLEKTVFTIHEVLELCETISSPKADEKGVALYFYTEPPISKRLYGDPTKLRQVILNLLSNAIKFTSRGMVKVMTSIEEASEEYVTIHFEVRDNGIGMTSEQLRRIFDPFAQADSSTTRKYGGTGLGLSITKNIIELMGGKLAAESVVGVGSKFSFTLTFEIAGAIDAVDAIRIGRHQKPTFIGDVLVCEDNDINQQVIEGHLARVGLHTTVVENGKLGIEAVKSKKKKPYDLIFMDIHMPVMDGLEAAKKLLEMGNTVPVVALTANAMSRDIDIYLENGISDYLAKPFVARDLWGCLLKYLTPVSMDDISEARHTGSHLSDKNASEATVFDRQAGIEQSGDDEELYDRLLLRFARNNKSTYRDINDAIVSGNTAHAHRLAHTLKGTAGTLGAHKLQEAAAALENAMSADGMTVSGEHLRELESHLNAALAELEPLLSKPPGDKHHMKTFDKEKAAALLDDLLPMLGDSNMGCLEMLGQIHDALSPASEDVDNLLRQIEDCDFELAIETAQRIRFLL